MKKADISNKKEEQYIHYANIIRYADSAIVSRDLEGKITTWNNAAEKLFGYKSEEAVGRNFSILVPPEQNGELEQIVRKIKRGQFIEDYETIRVEKNGKKISVIAKISPVIDSSGKIIGISIFDRDNREKKKKHDQEYFLIQAQRILSSSLNYKKTLYKIANILVPEIADWSAVHVVENGKLVQIAVAHKDPEKVKWALDLQKKMAREANEENSRERLKKLMSGKSQFYPLITDGMINKMVKKKEDREIIREIGLVSAITVPLVSGKKIVGSMSLVTTQKDHIYDEVDLRFAERLGRRAGQAIENSRLYTEAQTEIIKRKRVERTLRSSRDELSVILQNIADGISVFDGSGKLIYVNDALAYASGYKSPSEMLKDPHEWRNLFELKGEDGGKLSWQKLPGMRALKGEVAPQALVNYKNRVTGEDRWSIIKASPVFDETGKVSTVVEIANDITQQKELERRKDDFISIASHELKTPLTSVKGFVQLLKRGHVEFEKSYSYLCKIDLQLDKLTELIQDLLDLSKIQSGKIAYRMDKFKISEVVGEVVDDIQKTADDHKIILKNGVESRLMGDRDRISQVLINLLTNAIKYSPERSRVVVRVKEKGKRVVVGVKDFGIGINKNERNKIFDRFYRVDDTNDKTFPGLGIGLYLSKEIVLRHKGRIWVESKKGQGSTFYFSLPRLK